MLSLALAATLIGFVLLVLGLITGHLALAVACIVVCVLGLIFLIADIIRGGRDKGDDKAGADSRVGGDDAGLVGDAHRGVEDTTDESAAQIPGDLSATSPAAGLATAGVAGAAGAAGVGLAAGRDGGHHDESAASTEASAAPPSEAPTTPPSEAPTTQLPAGPTAAPAGQPVDGTYADYLRSVGADPAQEAVPAAEDPSIDTTSPPAGAQPASQAGMWPDDATDTEVFPAQPRSRHSQPEAAQQQPEQDWRGWPQPGAALDDSGWPQPHPQPQQPGGQEQVPASADGVDEKSGVDDTLNYSDGGTGKQKFDPLDPNWHPPSH